MSDMPEKISAYIKVDNSKAAWHGRLWSYRLSGYGVEYIRSDIHEKAVKERDALKEELRDAVIMLNVVLSCLKKRSADGFNRIYPALLPCVQNTLDNFKADVSNIGDTK